MTSERIGSLTILTACTYAFIQYLQTNVWIFPFPLYKLGLLIVLILMLISEKKKPGITGWLAISWSVALMLSSKFVLQLVMSEQQLSHFKNNLFVDVMLILFCVLFAAWAVMVSLKIQHQTARLLGVVFALSFSICLLLNLYSWAIIPLIGWLFCIFLPEKDRTPVHFSMITLFAFLYITAWTTAFYLGSANILGNL